MNRIGIAVGQLLGLLFLIGPLSDLVDSSESPAQVAAIALVLVVFVGLYLVILPPARLLAVRGRRTIQGVLAVFAAVAVLPLALGAPRSFTLLLFYVIAAAGMLLPAREAGAAIAITAAAVGGGLAAAGADSSTVAAFTLSVLGVGTVMLSLGSALRANRRLEAAREELARAAVSDERLRIARDLHDLLGHTLLLIALKSDLARKLVQSDPQRAQEELGEVQSVTRQALSDVREAVQGYRRRSFADALEDARATLAAAGIDCRVDSAVDELPADVETVLAWAVREASTNVARHSGARACAITLAGDANAVSLQVDDDGAQPVVGPTEGTGLAGMAQRARRLRGELEAGVRPEGGFRLRLTLPLEAT